MKAPCIDCDKQGCGSYHDKCEKYQEFVAERNRVCQNRKKEVDNRTYMLESTRRMKRLRSSIK